MRSKLRKFLQCVLLVLLSIFLAVLFAISPNFRIKAINWLIENFLSKKDKEKLVNKNVINKIGNKNKLRQNQSNDNESTNSGIKSVGGESNQISTTKIEIRNLTLNYGQKAQEDKKMIEESLIKDLVEKEFQKIQKSMSETESLEEITKALSKESSKKRKNDKKKQKK